MLAESTRPVRSNWNSNTIFHVLLPNDRPGSACACRGVRRALLSAMSGAPADRCRRARRREQPNGALPERLRSSVSPWLPSEPSLTDGTDCTVWILGSSSLGFFVSLGVTSRSGSSVSVGVALGRSVSSTTVCCSITAGDAAARRPPRSRGIIAGIDPRRSPFDADFDRQSRRAPRLRPQIFQRQGGTAGMDCDGAHGRQNPDQQRCLSLLLEFRTSGFDPQSSTLLLAMRDETALMACVGKAADPRSCEGTSSSATKAIFRTRRCAGFRARP